MRKILERYSKPTSLLRDLVGNTHIHSARDDLFLLAAIFICLSNLSLTCEITMSRDLDGGTEIVELASHPSLSPTGSTLHFSRSRSVIPDEGSNDQGRNQSSLPPMDKGFCAWSFVRTFSISA